MHSRTSFALASALVALAATAGPALAEQKILYQSGAWRAVAATQAGQQVCFVIASPETREPASLKRDPGNLFITTKPRREGGGSELSIRFGYRLAEGGHSLEVDDRSFVLMPQGEAAWLRADADEPTVLSEFRSGREVSVSVRSARGNATVDTYSLIGFSAAFDALRRQCHV
ncbi:MAG: invasion associated locus B family protein [Hyphomicrobiales bacterium]|nr:invasion associated locus B family protein [Hyphomicrobiales bacterium]